MSKPVILKNERGIAMMMTLVTMLLLSILAAELVYQNQVYTGIVFRQRDELRARLLARSALRLGQLQLVATTKAKAQLKSLGLGDSSLADQIWQTPLILPPPTPPGLTLLDQQAIDAFKKSLGIEGSLTVTISGESDRLDLNQLVRVMPKAQSANPNGVHGGTPVGGQTTAPAAPVDPEQIKEARDKLRKTYADLLDQIFEKKRQDDEGFRNKYSTLKADPLLLNLVAFMDPATKVDADNREKNEYYQTAVPTPYSLKDAPIISESELHMVKGFDDVIAGIVADHFTLRPTTSLNVNKATGTMLQALIPELSNDDLDRLLKRRDDTAAGGNFKSAQEFWDFLQTMGNFGDAKKRLEDNGITILGPETSYRIIVTSESGIAHKTWLAYSGNMPPLTGQDKTEAQQQQQQATFNNPQATQTTTTTSTGTSTGTGTNNSGDQLRILYLKAD